MVLIMELASPPPDDGSDVAPANRQPVPIQSRLFISPSTGAANARVEKRAKRARKTAMKRILWNDCVCGGGRCNKKE